MYYLYTKSHQDNLVKYEKICPVSLVGRNVGIIIKYLKTKLSPDITEPWRWHISVEDMFNVLGLKGNTIIINLKPNSDYLSLYQIKNIWGFSSNGWTPILFELKGILDDSNSLKYDSNNFQIEAYDDFNSIFTILYLHGTVINGLINGTWNFPGPSPTNSVLLWPEVLEFFADKMGYQKVY